MAHVIECPSGLSFHSRKLKGSEANLFTDRQLVRRGLLIGKILGSTYEGLLDAGPYKIGQGGAPPWDQLLVGDRIVALVKLRIATYGPEVDFKVQCDDETCRKRFDHDLNLESGLTLKSLSEEDREAFEAGNKLTTELEVEGVRHQIGFHLLTGKDELRLSALSQRSSGQQVTLSLAQRIDSISGVHANDKMRWLESLDLDILNALVEMLDEHDCGIDTAIECECPHCGNFMEVSLPLGSREFLLPKRKKAQELVQVDE